MTPLRRRLLLRALKLWDIGLAGLCLLVTLRLQGTGAFARATDLLTNVLAIRTSVGEVLLFLAFLVLWHVLYSAFALYESRRISRRLSEVGDIALASLLGTLALAAGGVVFSVEALTPTFLVMFWGLSAGSTVIGRWILRLVLRQLRLRGRNQRQVLIVGINDRTVQFARQLERRPELGYQLSGFVDDEWSGLERFRERGLVPLVNLSGFRGLLSDRIVDEVVIGLPMRSFHAHVEAICQKCKEQGIIVRFLSSIVDVAPGAARYDRFEEDTVVTVFQDRMSESIAMLTKRALDVSLSLVLLVSLTPLLAATAILIKVSSPGPVLFVQERVGRNKRTFRLYKFRTMAEDAEQQQPELEHLNEVEGPVFKIQDDPRITKMGRWLRRSSVDELPQLVNVVKGDMSLVGPRPLPLRDVQRFEEDWQRRRFSVRPGLTCLWQINGRSRLSFEQWMKLDMQYLDEWSLLLDLKILMRTIPAVLKGLGAA